MKRPVYPTIRISFIATGVEITDMNVWMDLPRDPRITVRDDVRHVDKSGVLNWYKVTDIHGDIMRLKPFKWDQVITITDGDRLAIHKSDIFNPYKRQ